MIGIDFVEVDRIKTDDRFLSKIAHDDEIEYIKSGSKSLQSQRVAALWATKEAVMKALDLGRDSGVTFKDIKLCHQSSGKPFVELFGVAKEKLDGDFKGKRIEISLSHSQTAAIAVAIIV